jgi:hypothetical protein
VTNAQAWHQYGKAENETGIKHQQVSRWRKQLLAIDKYRNALIQQNILLILAAPDVGLWEAGPVTA